MSSLNHHAQDHCSRPLLSKATNTPDEFAFCQKCKSRLRKVGGENDDLGTLTIIDDYLDSLKYINACHILINQIIQCRKPAQKITMPQMPNFLNVLMYLANDERGLSEVRNLNTLENLMREMKINDLDAGVNSPTATRTISSQTECAMADKEVVVGRTLANAETATQKFHSHDVRGTGIPRRILNSASKCSRRTPRSYSPCAESDVSHLKRRRSTSSLIVKENRSNPSVCREDLQTLPAVPVLSTNLESDEHCSVKEPPASIPPDEMDDYAKQLLLATDALHPQSPAPSARARKPRKGKSRTKRDFEMMRNFLLQWGLQMPPLESESAESILSRKRRPPLCFNSSDQIDCKKDSLLPKSSENSDVDTTVMESKPNEKDTSHKPSNASIERHSITTFNDLAASSAGLENTFITNEKPVWAHISGKSDDSDIEPDFEDTPPIIRHIQRIPPRPPKIKNVSFQTNQSAAAYIVTQKPKDGFLLQHRPKSYSDIDSDHLLGESDVDETVFDKKKRVKNSLRIRPPPLPEKVLTSVGLLTRNGVIRPDKERQILELRKQLATGMQTTLFRKPRNRKLETGDIIQLNNDFPPVAPARN